MSEYTDDPASERSAADADEELPDGAIEAAERLTRLAREAVDGNEADAYRERRADRLDEHEFRARVRDEASGDVLVLHPSEWHEDGVIRTDRIEDTSRAVEIPLEGAGDPDDWDEVDAHNRAIADAVRDEYGPVHGDNADAFADFMSNHYAKPIESATHEEREEFLAEYFVRNAWPSETQREAIEESITLALETANDGGPV